MYLFDLNSIYRSPSVLMKANNVCFSVRFNHKDLFSRVMMMLAIPLNLHCLPRSLT
jgi:hypothetical protein